MAAVSTAVITPLAGAAAIGTDAAAPWAAALALAAGAVYVVLGAARMGWVSNFLSRAVLAGFIFGFGVGIIIDQSSKLFGVSPGDGSYAEELVHIIGNLGDTSLQTLAVGALSLAILLPLRYVRPKWPRALLVVVLAIAASQLLDLSEHGVAVTGDIPTGLFSVGPAGRRLVGPRQADRRRALGRLRRLLRNAGGRAGDGRSSTTTSSTRIRS